MLNNQKGNVKRTYKDGIFRALFNDESVLLELYSALSGKDYSKDTKIEIITLDNAIFNDIKDDLAFLVEDKFIVMTEHQSTASPNLPVRLFCYLAREYEKLIDKNIIFSTTLEKIPTPELYVFYNGTDKMPSEWELKLSDAFKEKSDIISVEVKVKVINVNYASGAEILEKSKTMRGYSFFIHKVRRFYENSNDLEYSVDAAIRECIEEGILSDFLMKHKGDIMSVLEVNLTREERDRIREYDGEIKKAKEIAVKLKAKGMDHDQIAEVTGLLKEDIENL